MRRIKKRTIAPKKQRDQMIKTTGRSICFPNTPEVLIIKIAMANSAMFRLEVDFTNTGNSFQIIQLM
jgi:hypothetical protein